MPDDLPEGHEYVDYEIPYEARLNIKEIEKGLKQGNYTDETTVREHLDLLENLDTEVTQAMESERRIGRYNATLKHDQDKIRKLVKQLEDKLKELDE
jgi:hypothetical protein